MPPSRLLTMHLAPPVRDAESFANGNNNALEIGQQFQSGEIVRNLVGMGERVIGQHKNIGCQLRDEQVQLGGSATPVGIEKDQIKRPRQTLHDLGSIAAV